MQIKVLCFFFRLALIILLFSPHFQFRLCLHGDFATYVDSQIKIQHPPTQWNLRGRDEAALKKVYERKIKIPPFADQK
jgi:hypothetical protein